MSEQKCPKCGSADKNPGVNNTVVRAFKCGTFAWGDGVIEDTEQCAELSALRQRVQTLESALRPIVACLGNEIRMTENNTTQVFYNFVPMGLIRRASAAITAPVEALQK